MPAGDITKILPFTEGPTKSETKLNLAFETINDLTERVAALEIGAEYTSQIVLIDGVLYYAESPMRILEIV